MASSFRRTALASFAAAIAVVSVPVSAQESWRGDSAPDTPIRTTQLPPSGVDPASQVADRYLERARGDPANPEPWVYCAAAAMKRSIAGDAEADAYGRDLATTMKAAMDNPAASPCEDAIPARVWDDRQKLAVGDVGRDDTVTAPDPAATDPGALTPAEEERLRQANAAADTQERERVAAQAAAQQRRADAQGRYDREREDYDAQVAASQAADAEYQRQLEEHRRLLESGHYQTPQ